MAIAKYGIKSIEEATEIVKKICKPKDLRESLGRFYDNKKVIAHYLEDSKGLVLFGIK